MPREIDQDPNSKTFGLMVEKGTPAAAMPVNVGATPPVSTVTDRPQAPLTETYNKGGGLIINDQGYLPGGSATDMAKSGTDKVSYGTDEIRNQRNINSGMASGLMGEMNDWQYKAELDRIKAMAADLGRPLNSISDQQQIAAAMAAEEAKWNPMIAEAQSERTKGMADTTITGGERGGFMNTQFAGMAAVLPTAGKTWIGAGGQMEAVKSAYDRNINQLQEKKMAAIQAAKAAAEAAIRGEESDAYKRALELFEVAKQTDKDLSQMAKDKFDMMNAQSDYEQARITTGLGDLEKISAVGGEIPEQLKYNIDSYYGQGFTDKYKMASEAAAQVDSESSQIEAFKRVTDILKNYPKGQTLTIAGNEYQGIGEDANNQIFREVDAGGNVSYVTIDKVTGEPVNIASGGRLSTPQKSSGNPTTTTENGAPGVKLTSTQKGKLISAGILDIEGKMIEGFSDQDIYDYLYGDDLKKQSVMEKLGGGAAGATQEEGGTSGYPAMDNYSQIVQEVSTGKSKGYNDAAIKQKIMEAYGIPSFSADQFLNIVNSGEPYIPKPYVTD